MGFGTNRIVGKKLDKSGLSATQMKGMSILHGICGVKKIEGKEIDSNTLNKLTIKKIEGNKSKLTSDIEN